MRANQWVGLAIVLALLLTSKGIAQVESPTLPSGDGYHPDTDDLVFIHHSCGANWLSNSLHAALLAKEYVDERNDITYGTDLTPDPGRPDSLAPVPGDTTDMCHWILWFNDYLENVRNHATADGFNRIVMFKSCYPMSNVTSYGVEPGDPFDCERTLTNYMAVYRHPAGPGNAYTHNGYTYRPLEDIFAAHPETLFIPITAPPRHYAPYDATNDEEAHRARLFNNWLKTDWLDSYNAAHPDLNNVAVFDWFDFLAYADSHPEHPNRLRAEYGGESGNSHPNDYANSQSTLVFATNSDNFIDDAWTTYMSSTSFKAAATSTPVSGEPLTYTIVVQDLAAPFGAPVDMTDVVPDGLSYIPGSLSATIGTVDDGEAPTLYWTGVLTPTPVATITYAVTVDSPPQEVIVNSAVIAAPDYHTITRTATVTVTEATVEPDLTPSRKDAAPPSVRQGERITYTIAVRDGNGPLSPTVYLTDTVPEGLTYVPGSLSATGGTVTDTWAPTLHWSGVLSPTPAVTVTYVVTADAAGFQTITNEVTIAIPDHQTITRTTTVTISPSLGQPDLTPSTKAACPQYAALGDPITYTIAVRNGAGPLTHTVYLTDTVPAGLSYVPGSLSATGGTVTDTMAPVLYWTGGLSPTPAVTITYVVTVSSDLAQAITNTAFIAVPHYQIVTRTATVRINLYRIFLPTITRDYVPEPPTSIPR